MSITFKTYLYEGLIDLPHTFKNQLELETESIIISYSHAKIIDINKELKKTPDILSKSLAMFNEFCLNHFPHIIKKDFDITKERIVKKFSNFKKADLPIEYQQLFSKEPPNMLWNLDDNKLKFQLSFDSKLLAKMGNADGVYRADQNILDINLNKFKNFSWNYLLELIDKKTKETNEDKLEALDHKLDQLFSKFKQLIIEYKGVLEHELVHYLQFKVLSRGSTKQVNQTGKSVSKPNSNDSKEESYYSSQIEFDPQIRTAITKTITWFEKLKTNHNYLATWQIVAKLVIGEISLDKMKSMLHIDDEEEFYANDMFPLRFFETLKKTDIKQYKKAIKYYMLELEKRLPND